jgi:flavin reductase (DIM6/NTAB) family NADH-FMN oxidoreductase RutF
MTTERTPPGSSRYGAAARDDDDVFVFVPAEHGPRARNKMLSSVVGVCNVAPYSYYQPITWSPMLIGVAIGLRGADRRHDSDLTGLKDTYVNLMATGDFVVNVTTEVFCGTIENAATEFPPEISEFDHVPWTPVPSRIVTAPSVAEAPVRLECRVDRVIDLGNPDGAVKYVVGEVQCIVADPRVVVEGSWVDDLALQPVGRLGGRAFLRTIPEAVYEEQRISVLPEHRDH